MSKILPCLAVAFAIGAASPAAWSQDVALLCSTTLQAEAVIAGSGSGEPLVASVAQSVPSDVPNCIPSYCEAVRDEAKSVKVAVGAGISEALSVLLANDEKDKVTDLLGNACSKRCDEIVVTAIAASQATTVAGLCETGFGGASGSAPSLLQLEASGAAGGGQSASEN